jgi:hypothetical protein
MASPLLSYANARVKLTSEGAASIVNGRFVAADGPTYLVKAFIKRAQYSGVSSGSKKLPLESQLDGEMMPGASGDSFYYRGYALQYAVVDASYDPVTGDESLLTFIDISAQPAWLLPGSTVEFYFGEEEVKVGKIQRSSGLFGGKGIDEIVYKEIGGVEIQISGGEVQN